MSWLSQGLSDIGLGGLNTFWNQNKNIIEDVGIGLGAAGLAATGFGLAGIGPLAGALGGTGAEIGGALGLGGAEAAGGGALGFAGDVGATAGVADWSVPSLGAIPDFAGGEFGASAAGSTAGLYNAATPAEMAAFSNPSAAGAAPQAALGGAGSADAAVAGNPVEAAYWDQVLGTSAVPSPGTATPSLFDKAASGLASNPWAGVGAAAGIGGLGYNIYAGQQQNKQLQALESQINTASQTNAQTQQDLTAMAKPEFDLASQMQNYLQTNTLPPDAQAAMDQQTKLTKASITQGYAQRGMSTDPTQNSSLATDLANVDQQMMAMGYQLQNTLFTAGQQAFQSANAMIASGLSASQLSAQLPIQMQQLDLALSTATSQAIASFATGLSGSLGKTGGTTIINQQPAQATV